MSNSARDTVTSTRWTAKISYISALDKDYMPTNFSIGIEEVEELQEIIEAMDDWNNIIGSIDIELVYNFNIKRNNK